MHFFNRRLASMSSASFALIAKGFVFLGESSPFVSDRLRVKSGIVAWSEFDRPNKGERSPSSEKQSGSRCGFLQRKPLERTVSYENGSTNHQEALLRQP